MLNNKAYIGWDVGGAHLKAALLIDGKVQFAVQVPCALWRGLNFLKSAIEILNHQLSSYISNQKNVIHAVTMTGELVDLFENRHQGVLEISRVMHDKLGEKVYFFSLNQPSNFNFIIFSQVEKNWQTIASVNWFASACLIAQQHSDGLLIDMGSTTTDFVLLHNGEPSCIGLTDSARLQSQELVYTGVVRTPLMALTQYVTFKNRLTALAAEYFATTADVYRLLNELPEIEDMADTADGKDKSADATARRIARMIGYDFEEATLQDWQHLAHNFKQIQLNQLCKVAMQHIERLIKLVPEQGSIKIIGVGAGQFLLKELVVILNQMVQTQFPFNHYVIEYAEAFQATPVAQHTNFSHIKTWGSICFPAVAVATLAFQKQLK